MRCGVHRSAFCSDSTVKQLLEVAVRLDRTTGIPEAVVIYRYPAVYWMPVKPGHDSGEDVIRHSRGGNAPERCIGVSLK
jgi:hypothetical protein